jgi:hypothetical protein
MFKKLFIFIDILLLFSFSFSSYGQILKSIVYDFDGFDIGQTNLPEGDYKINDLTYSIAENPLSANDMLGDRVLQLNLDWKNNYGAFGKSISRYIEFDPATDKFNFYFYNPLSNNQEATFDIVIADDDNNNNTYEYASDDTWKKSLVIPGSSGWQLISVPLSDFNDSNTGGNGIFDIALTENKGMLLTVEFRFTKKNPLISNAIFYLDMINFSEGNLPTGSTIFDLPSKSFTDYCLLGAYQNYPRRSEYLIPSQVERLFPSVPKKKLQYVHFYIDFAIDGTTVAKEFPGDEVQTLLSNGYTPIISWEPMFKNYDPLDYRQPHLSNIINGDYDSYIDQFADKIKTFSDTIIIRFMHEFNGNWYSWSLTENNHDPDLYIAAFRKVVDRFRARGATNVKWMWCINFDYYPYQPYNWIVPAYPGDDYVDIVASDIYNNHYPPALPWWRSFRSQATESYYYLTKYFSKKPLFIGEFGCRERFNSENNSSQSKGQWYEMMDKELQSNFHKVRALIFFNSAPDQNWFINSSPSALQSLTDNVWSDDYYFGIPNPPISIATSSPSISDILLSGDNIPKCAASIQASAATTFCKGGNVILNSPIGSNYTYQWKKNGTDITGATTFNYNASLDGDYQVMVSYPGCTTLSAPTKVSVNTSLISRITPGGPTTFCPGNGVTLYANTCSGYIYQWKKNGAAISGAIGSSYIATDSGNYQVKIIKGTSMAWSPQVKVIVNNCESNNRNADTMFKITNYPEKVLSNDTFTLHVYPNPSTGLFTFEICMEDIAEENVDVKVINAIGQSVYSRSFVRMDRCIKETIELESSLATGVYFLQIKTGNNAENTRILLNK